MFAWSRPLSRLLPALALLVTACAEEQPGIPPPLEQLYFPTGIALTPEVAGQPQHLLVVSSNLDLRYRAGVLHAFDVAAIDALAEGAQAPNCQVPGCSPGRVTDFGSALSGTVEIGDFGGEVAVAQLESGALRAFVPMRASRQVVAVEIGADGQLSCAMQGDGRCAGPVFRRPDPYTVLTAAGNVYVGHIGRDNDDRPEAAVGAAFADADMWTGGGGGFELVGLGEQAIGGIASHCAGEGDAASCTLFASTRSFEQGFNPLYLFDFRPGELRSGAVFSRNVYGQQRGLDSRGVAASSSGAAVYIASRFPDALATVDVTRVSEAPVPGCVVPPGAALPGGACPEDPVPLDGAAEPRFVVADLVAAPAAPNTARVLPRTLPDGTTSDLVVLTAGDGLALFDMRTGTLAGAIEQVGNSPSALAARTLPDGSVRLYVPSFGGGTLAVVDIPDPLQPGRARVIAILGRVQEGGF